MEKIKKTWEIPEVQLAVAALAVFAVLLLLVVHESVSPTIAPLLNQGILALESQFGWDPATVAEFLIPTLVF
jgi:predicted small integral membrane protein